MVDVLSRKQRQHCMSRIRGKDTKPEIIVRRLVHAMGYRYRLHRKDLPGCPDLVFPGLRKVILVHGCFWHRHRCRYGSVMPATRRKFWKKKLVKNRVRDRANTRALRKQGWRVLVVWECQTANPDRLAERLEKFLRG